MKKYIILCLLILLVQSISAQRIVEGVVTDVGGHPVSAAIIKTVDATTKKTLHFCQTDTKGKFTITAQEGNILSKRASIKKHVVNLFYIIHKSYKHNYYSSYIIRCKLLSQIVAPY